MRRKEHALEAVLPHLTAKTTSLVLSSRVPEHDFSAQYSMITTALDCIKCISQIQKQSIKMLMTVFQISHLCQSEVLCFDPDTPGDGFEDFSSAGVLLAHAHQKLRHIHKK